MSLTLGLIIAGVGVDLWSKRWAESALQITDIPLIEGILKLNLHTNSGIAFSLPLEGILLIGLTVSVLSVITVMLARLIHQYRGERQSGFEIIALALILSGGIGNAYERIAFSFVTDFIDIRSFAICNIADILITLGAVLLIGISLTQSYGGYKHSNR